MLFEVPGSDFYPRWDRKERATVPRAPGEVGEMLRFFGVLPLSEPSFLRTIDLSGKRLLPIPESKFSI